jgi:hypothetical protein
MMEVGEYLRRDTRSSVEPRKISLECQFTTLYYVSLFDRMVDCGLSFGHITTPMQLDVM